MSDALQRIAELAKGLHKSAKIEPAQWNGRVAVTAHGGLDVVATFDRREHAEFFVECSRFRDVLVALGTVVETMHKLHDESNTNWQKRLAEARVAHQLELDRLNATDIASLRSELNESKREAKSLHEDKESWRKSCDVVVEQSARHVAELNAKLDKANGRLRMIATLAKGKLGRGNATVSVADVLELAE